MGRKIGERILLATTLWEYSHWYYNNGQLDEAEDYLEQADALFRQVGAKFNPTPALFAEIAWLQGDYRHTEKLYMEQQERLRLLGDKKSREFIVAQLGVLAIEENNLDQAQAYLEEALGIAQEIDDNVFVAYSLAMLARLSYFQEDIGASKQHLAKSLYMARDFENKDVKAYILDIILSSPFFQQLSKPAQLLGAIDQAAKESGRPIPPLIKRYYDQNEQYVREKLGNADYKKYFAEGHRISIDEALDHILRTAEEM
jgi:tetratricopeptide (TPR) repeat protein